MVNNQSNSFHFMSAKGGINMTVLNAVMSDFSYAKHAHEEIAIGITLQGVQEFSCNGRQFYSSPGDIILFNPGDVHNGNPGTLDALRYVMLYLDTAELYPQMKTVSTSEKAECRFPETHCKDAVLRFLIMELAKVAAKKHPLSFEQEHCLQRMAERIAQMMGTFCHGAWRTNKDPLLLKVRDYILDNIAEDISIEDLSRVASISKYHFIRLFRSQFGQTPHQFILNRKVNKVRKELIKGIAPSTAANNFGFFDVSHLNRHFKRIFGVTPKQYQSQLTR